VTEWTIVFRRRAEKALERLPLKDQRRVFDATKKLAADPYTAPNVKAMKGSNSYRLRVADYRVIYSLIDDRLVIEVIRIGHRSDVYR
jgi:mRNA interferase RelE/StbE